MTWTWNCETRKLWNKPKIVRTKCQPLLPTNVNKLKIVDGIELEWMRIGFLCRIQELKVNRSR
jgi:hypothetical protein